MNTPFPYFGGKSRISSEVWQRFGNPSYYFEPFAGALGVLLGRPTPGKYEYVGDTDCLITNFFRAAKYGDSRELARLADWPTSQLDLEARTKWLRKQRHRLHRLLTDGHPHQHDLECAAWYAWVQSVRISSNGATIVLGRTAGVRRQSEDLEGYFAALGNRIKNVTIDYGDWTRMTNAAERNCKRANCAILLDPPYDHSVRQKALYAHDSGDVSAYVRRWALARATTHPRLRIALCGFEGEHRMPSTWEELPWWSRMGKGRERIWFSPNCLKVGVEKTA